MTLATRIDIKKTLCIAAIVLAAVLLALPGKAWAETDLSRVIEITPNFQPHSIDNADQETHIVASFNIKNRLDKEIELVNVSEVISDGEDPTFLGSISIDINSEKKIAGNGHSRSLAIRGTLVKGSTYADLKFEFKYGENEDETGYVICRGVQLVSAPSTDNNDQQLPEQSIPDNNEATTEDTEFKLRISTVDTVGALVPTPSGDYGEEILVRLPLTCVKGSVYDVKVTPVLDKDVEKFPFDIDLVDYTLSYPHTMGQGSIVEFKYNWRLSEKATVGVKKVDFTVTYRDGFEGTLKSGTVSVFVNVEKGLSPTSGDASASVPKLIIESYSISPEKIYAGETFDVEFTVRNTSSSETVQNVQIRVKDMAETATVVPASGGSNTIYIDKIGKGDTSTQKLSFQTAPDAAAKAYTLNLDFSYEAASTNTAHTAAESIAVPILQKIRLKCDEPVVYDEMGWLGQSCSMYVKMYNMGRSTIYNCMVDVEGPGLEMEESYFGGNLNGGGTLSADFSIIPSVAGDISGEVIISYEDVYGEPGEERLPFTLYVEDLSAMQPEMEEDMMVTVEQEPEPAIPGWVWIAVGGAAACALAVVLVKALKKRRRRSLEDDI